jgi:hypothetical protein
VQAAAPASEYVPGGHTCGRAAGGGQAEPAGQASHTVPFTAPVALLKAPGGQTVQAAAPPPLKVPRGHTWGARAGWGQAYPAAHATHTAALVAPEALTAAAVPLAQGVQALAFTLLP